MDWSAVAAGIAAVIALIAVCVSIFEAREARRHYRLSAQPRLRTAYVEGTKIVLENTGPGTAAIKEFRIRANGESFTPKDDSRRIVKAMEDELRKALPSARQLSCKAYIPDPDGDSLRPQGQLELLVVKNPPESDRDRWKVLERMERVRFDIRYESVYGEERILGDFDLRGKPPASAWWRWRRRRRSA